MTSGRNLTAQPDVTQDAGCSTVQKDIATQLIDAMLGEGPEGQRMVDIALGGGRKEFLPKPYAPNPQIISWPRRT